MRTEAGSYIRSTSSKQNFIRRRRGGTRRGSPARKSSRASRRRPTRLVKRVRWRSPKICVESIMVMTVRSVAATCLAKRIYGKKQRVSHKSLSHQPMGLSIGRSSWTQGCLKIGCMFRKQSSITHSSDQGCFPGASGSIVLPRLGSRQLRRRYGLNYHSMTLFLLGSDMQCIHHHYMQTPQELASLEEHRPRALGR